MEKRTVHSFNGLAIFVFFLYFANVSSDPINPIKIIDFMKSDDELCTVPEFLYTKTIISTCVNESYPLRNLTEDYIYRNTFLCLIFYDTWYKVCQYTELHDWFLKNFNNEESFNSYLLQLLPKKEHNYGNMFCKSITGITFSHKKLKSMLSFLHNLDNYNKCYPFCFGMNDQFIPLCEILVWSKSIDNDIKKLSTESQTGSENIAVKKNQNLNEDQSLKGQELLIHSQITTSKLHQDSTTKDELKGSTSYKDTAKSSSSERKLAQTLATQMNLTVVHGHGGDQTLSQKKTNNEPADPKSIEVNYHKVPQNLKKKPQGVSEESQDTNKNLQDINKASQGVDKVSQGVEIVPQGVEIVLQAAEKVPQGIEKVPQGIEKVPQGVEKVPQGVEKVPQGVEKVPQGVEKVPQTTNKELQNLDKEPQTEGPLPGNKDSHITNKAFDEFGGNTETNQDEWNHPGDDKSIDDQNDPGGLDAPVDTDQPENMHKLSEDKDNMSSFHTMRTDEESHFFTYFTVLSLISIVAYIGYYNKQKILAIVLEGRRSRNRRGRPRPNTANYRKLDCTLEEAVTSQCNANVTHVIY
ncbi:uncharacterized protein LOC143362831 [Halictus rubicundus]|uniref:uncharacterized protein LOC143362831 n=1 Tax=Halictus rubicundus TaxID=77578 RepID=UPI00403747E2